MIMVLSWSSGALSLSTTTMLGIGWIIFSENFVTLNFWSIGSTLDTNVTTQRTGFQYYRYSFSWLNERKNWQMQNNKNYWNSTEDYDWDPAVTLLSIGLEATEDNIGHLPPYNLSRLELSNNKNKSDINLLDTSLRSVLFLALREKIQYLMSGISEVS